MEEEDEEKDDDDDDDDNNNNNNNNNKCNLTTSACPQVDPQHDFKRSLVQKQHDDGQT